MNVNVSTYVDKQLTEHEKRLVEHSQDIFEKFDFDFYKDVTLKEEFVLETPNLE